MSKKLAMSVAYVLVWCGCALGQTQAGAPKAGAGRGGDDVVPPGGRVSWFWEDPDKAWLAAWYRARNALVEKHPDLPFDTTSILVQFKPGTAPEAIGAALATIGGRTIQTWGLVPGLHHVAIPADKFTVAEALAIVKAHGAEAGTIDFAEPDHFGRLGATPNDTFYAAHLWGMNNTGQTIQGVVGVANADIDASMAWDVTTGSAAVVVGMADSGIRSTHEDLAANRWTNPGEVAGNGIDDDGNGRIDDTWGWDFWNNDNNPSDDNGHGTHTAGTVGAVGNNGKGVTGVCWTVRLAGLKIGNRQGSVSTSAAVSAVNYCVGKGIKLSNHSWGGGAFSSSLNSAITSAQAAGHMLVCAAGNGGADGIGDNNDSIPHYPSNYTQDNIIAVASIDNRNLVSTFSNFGATSVDIGAPGTNIASCYIGNGGSANNTYVYLSGTSMATPHVTGVCALVWSVNPTWTYSQVRTKVLSTAKAVSALSGKCVTGGCVNANSAVR